MRMARGRSGFGLRCEAFSSHNAKRLARRTTKLYLTDHARRGCQGIFRYF